MSRIITSHSEQSTKSTFDYFRLRIVQDVFNSGSETRNKHLYQKLGVIASQKNATGKATKVIKPAEAKVKTPIPSGKPMRKRE